MTPEKPNTSLDIDLLTWYEVNKKSLFLGLGVMVVVVAGVIIWRHRAEHQVVEASDALLQVTTLKTDNPLSVDALNSVASRYPGTPIGMQAQLLAARELFSNGKYAEARALFEKVADAPVMDLVVVGKLGRATCLDAENKTQEALAAYQAVIALPEADAVAARARLAKARLHESLKQPQEALALYNEVGKSSQGTTANDAFIRRANLLRQHPELDKPAVTTNTVTVQPAPLPPTAK
ncbi:MAG: tetratricopeptide repeat protein [Verrucomicrobiota bacterium]